MDEPLHRFCTEAPEIEMTGTQLADAEKARLAGEAVREAVARYGKVHSEVVKALEEYARCQHKAGNHAESLQAARRAAEISSKLAGKQPA